MRIGTKVLMWAPHGSARFVQIARKVFFLCAGGVVVGSMSVCISSVSSHWPVIIGTRPGFGVLFCLILPTRLYLSLYNQFMSAKCEANKLFWWMFGVMNDVIDTTRGGGETACNQYVVLWEIGKMSNMQFFAIVCALLPISWKRLLLLFTFKSATWRGTW